DYTVFFRRVPEFDIVYFDGVMQQPRVKADWDSDGQDDDPADPRILAAHYAGHAAQWEHVRKLQPRSLLMGNTADADLSKAEWRGGGCFEGGMGGACRRRVAGRGDGARLVDRDPRRLAADDGLLPAGDRQPQGTAPGRLQRARQSGGLPLFPLCLRVVPPRR